MEDENQDKSLPAEQETPQPDEQTRRPFSEGVEADLTQVMRGDNPPTRPDKNESETPKESQENQDTS